ncbi:hypothetical protein QZH41_002622 [Actinostola sp. cb2023]|nr:hypothetical protein QZH41_002622 [Actinostola sp. cb2023]
MATLLMDVQPFEAVSIPGAPTSIHREVAVLVPGNPEPKICRGGISFQSVAREIEEFWPGYCSQSFLERLPQPFKEFDPCVIRQSLKELRHHYNKASLSWISDCAYQRDNFPTYYNAKDALCSVITEKKIEIFHSKLRSRITKNDKEDNNDHNGNDDNDDDGGGDGSSQIPSPKTDKDTKYFQSAEFSKYVNDKIELMAEALKQKKLHYNKEEAMDLFTDTAAILNYGEIMGCPGCKLVTIWP